MKENPTFFSLPSVYPVTLGGERETRGGGRRRENMVISPSFFRGRTCHRGERRGLSDGGPRWSFVRSRRGFIRDSMTPTASLLLPPKKRVYDTFFVPPNLIPPEMSDAPYPNCTRERVGGENPIWEIGLSPLLSLFLSRKCFSSCFSLP